MSYFIQTRPPDPMAQHTYMFLPSIPDPQPACPQDSTSELEEPVSPAKPMITTAGQIEIPVVNTTLPPVTPLNKSGELRFYLYPLDPDDPTLFGIYSQFKGRTMWLMLVPQFPESPLHYWLGEHPPVLGNHPTKWRVEGAVGSEWKSLYNIMYQKYVVAKRTDQYFDFSDTLTDECKFYWFSRTSLGPVVPTPPTDGMIPQAEYHIISNKFGTALTSSLTSPYLTLTTKDYTSTNQKFYYRAVDRPSPVFPATPFTYNMYMVASPTTMYAIEDTGSIGIRTAAGAWEAFMIQTSTNPDFFGRFKIVSYAFNTRLRANSDGSVSVVSSTVSEALEDFFSFVPVEYGTPYWPDSPKPCEKE